MLNIIEKELAELKNNKIIRDFVESSAYELIAIDIVRLDPSRICTPKAAVLIVHSPNNKDVKERWEKYVAAGYTAVIMEKYNM